MALFPLASSPALQAPLVGKSLNPLSQVSREELPPPLELSTALPSSDELCQDQLALDQTPSLASDKPIDKGPSPADAMHLRFGGWTFPQTVRKPPLHTSLLACFFLYEEFKLSPYSSDAA
ncbi:hypothetical protein CDV31_013163 [Fusarium ambrosium]|uniref:Uncharacterized protein n=1 Tax=Fusarium ambrosium TaxID=131363 RepID=A0A428T541_9HYPO|nr:hypothetical protein CDV31_013163 [Fusarium ambrosium]